MNIRTYLLTNLISGVMGMAMLAGGFWLLNVLTPRWDFEEIFREKGVSGGAIVVAAFLLGLAIIIARAAF